MFDYLEMYYHVLSMYSNIITLSFFILCLPCSIAIGYSTGMLCWKRSAGTRDETGHLINQSPDVPNSVQKLDEQPSTSRSYAWGGDPKT